MHAISRRQIIGLGSILAPTFAISDISPRREAQISSSAPILKVELCEQTFSYVNDGLIWTLIKIRNHEAGPNDVIGSGRKLKVAAKHMQDANFDGVFANAASRADFTTFGERRMVFEELLDSNLRQYGLADSASKSGRSFVQSPAEKVVYTFRDSGLSLVLYEASLALRRWATTYAWSQRHKSEVETLREGRDFSASGDSFKGSISVALPKTRPQLESAAKSARGALGFWPQMVDVTLSSLPESYSAALRTAITRTCILTAMLVSSCRNSDVFEKAI